VMQHRMGGVVKQIAAIEEWNDLYAVRKDAIVEFVDLLVNTFQSELRVLALLQKNNAFDDVIVIDDLAVLTMNDLTAPLFVRVVNARVVGTPGTRRLGCRQSAKSACFADLAKTNLRTLDYRRDVFDPQ